LVWTTRVNVRNLILDGLSSVPTQFALLYNSIILTRVPLNLISLPAWVHGCIVCDPGQASTVLQYVLRILRLLVLKLPRPRHSRRCLTFSMWLIQLRWKPHEGAANATCLTETELNLLPGRTVKFRCSTAGFQLG